ncbi:MAG: DUF4177 domain-containing protein [Planctomycetaceae bacterium]|nr:DUF4177 domain-containing protein [Planctomycetaceae bacterium]
MPTWEYKYLSAEDLEKRGFFRSVKPEDVEKYFNALGAEGWEIINVDFTDTNAFIDFRGVARRPCA